MKSKINDVVRSLRICNLADVNFTSSCDLSSYNNTTKTLTGLHFVYFLSFNNEIKYIGKTTDLNLRIGTHKSCMQFDKIFYCLCSNSYSASALEFASINMLNPASNKSLKKQDIIGNIRAIKEFIKINIK